MSAHSGVLERRISVRVIRADGSVDDLGVVAYWHRSLWRRVWWAMCHRRDPVAVLLER